MSARHFKHWPSYANHELTAPATNLYYNAEVSARRYPDKPFVVFYDTPLTFAGFHDETQRIAGFLEHQCGVKQGDRVLLLMQNSPQFMIGYYAILRANAVVVPLNPMNTSGEILKYAHDAGGETVLVSQELYARVEPLLGSGALKHAVVAAYSDYLKVPTTLTVPDFVAAPRRHPRRRRRAVAGRAGCRSETRAAHLRSRRPRRDALHLRNDRAAQGSHAFAPHRHAYHGRPDVLVRHGA